MRIFKQRNHITHPASTTHNKQNNQIKSKLTILIKQTYPCKEKVCVFSLLNYSNCSLFSINAFDLFEKNKNKKKKKKKNNNIHNTHH